LGCGSKAADPYRDFGVVQEKPLIFHFSPNVRESRPEIIKKYHQAFTNILTTLGIVWEKDIHVYMLANYADGEQITGKPLAYAQKYDCRIFTSPSHSAGHELCHILSTALPGSGGANQILDEGLAQSLNQRNYDNSYVAAMELLSGLIAKRPFTEGSFIPYHTRASLAEYLIDLRGMDKFKALWGYEKLSEGLPAVYDLSLSRTEEEWRTFVAGKIGQTPAVFEQAWIAGDTIELRRDYEMFERAVREKDIRLVSPAAARYFEFIFERLEHEGFCDADWQPESIDQINHRWSRVILGHKDNRENKLVLIFVHEGDSDKYACILWPPAANE